MAGYSVRTNNAREMNGKAEIGNLWQRFMQQDLGSVIPHRTDPAIYVVYSDYASNEKGDYTYTLGVRVWAADVLPANMTSKIIVPGSYAVFTTDKGPVGQVVQAEWKKIWATTPQADRRQTRLQNRLRGLRQARHRPARLAGRNPHRTQGSCQTI